MNEPKIRILYAEDDAFGAEITKKMLEKENFEVKIAPDGNQAWLAYKEEKPNILLLDLDMPGKNGLEITRLVREQDRHIQIIVYTSHEEPEKEIALLDAGADEFISKEKSPQVLLAYLKRIREKIIAYPDTPQVYLLSEHTVYNGISRVLTIDGQSTQLKQTDARFLQLLCAKREEVADKDFLLHGIWGKATVNKSTELKKYASHIRTYLKADPTLAVKCRNSGYIILYTGTDKQ